MCDLVKTHARARTPALPRKCFVTVGLGGRNIEKYFENGGHFLFIDDGCIVMYGYHVRCAVYTAIYKEQQRVVVKLARKDLHYAATVGKELDQELDLMLRWVHLSTYFRVDGWRGSVGCLVDFTLIGFCCMFKVFFIRYSFL